MARVGEKILVRGVNWLGDAVMTTPALQRLREARPQAHITLLTHEKLAGLWGSHPHLDEVLTFAPRESVWSVARRLRARQFDLALVLPNSARSALEVFFARIPERIGYGRRLLLTQPIQHRASSRMRKRSEAEVKERVRKQLPRETFPVESHHVHDYLRLVAALGASDAVVAPTIGVSESELAEVRQRFGFNASEPLFGLNAGAEYGPAKRWPEERFVAAALALHRETNCAWVLLGGPGDRELATRLKETIEQQSPGTPLFNVAGRTSLRELCAVLKACDLVLTNDTGPMHVASAVGTPVIVPFGSTSAELTGPVFAPNARVISGEASCAPCFLRECPIDFRCMQDISVERVVAAALEVFATRTAK
jgi:heptosyltransferase II